MGSKSSSSVNHLTLNGMYAEEMLRFRPSAPMTHNIAK